jgi:hypothetical protein
MLFKILFHPTIFNVLFIAFFLLNVYVFHSTPIGVILLALFIFVYGWEMGSIIASQEKGPIRWWIGLLCLTSFILLILTVAYYIASVPKELTYLLILLTPPLIGILRKRHSKPSFFEHFHLQWNERKHRIPGVVYLAIGGIAFLGAIFLQHVANSAITDAVRSVWERLDASVLLMMGLLLLLLFGLLTRGRERAFSLLSTSFVLFLFLSLAIFVFPIGFGFDSFIHQATEKYLAEFGTMTPKPFYYIGQYALVLFTHHGFLIPIKIADTFLVPVLTALLLPSAWYTAALHITGKKSLSTLTLTGLFLIPLSSFIVTTPQALANLFTLLLILASVPYVFEAERPRLWFCGLIAVAALAIHPIAGLPALFYFAMLAADPDRVRRNWQSSARTIFFSMVGVASVILPGSFLLNAWLSDQTLSIDWAALNPLHLLSSLNLNVFFENRFNPLIDFAYLYGRNAFLILFLTALVAWWLYRRELSKRVRILLWMALALTINYLILKTAIDFSFLINYERMNYATRLIPLIVFFLIPFFILGMGHLFLNLRNHPLILHIATIVLLCGFSLSAFYIAYPRRDAYEMNRGFNTSIDDISTVYLIEEWAKQKPYLVLANQSVSAAAISELGFRYYGDLFFYPIPTGEPLYQQFLAMNGQPTRETARTALDLVPMHGDVFTLFFVVNNYWWDAERIIETAKTTADDWRAVGGGAIHVFRYDFQPSR